MSTAVLELEAVEISPLEEGRRSPNLYETAPHRLVSLLNVIQIYAHVLVGLLDELNRWSNDAAWILLPMDDPARARSQTLLRHILEACEKLNMASALKQIRSMSAAGMMTSEQFSAMVIELRRRINEDLENVAFFCVTDPAVTIEFFKSVPSEEFTAMNVLEWKTVGELFGSEVTSRFTSALDDMEQAGKCFVLARYTACVFHLMRVVEIGVIKVAKLSGCQDPKPSWGSILTWVEKLVLRTKRQDLDSAVQPHIDLLGQLLPEMQAIQRAWRNKVSHVEDKLIPIDARIDGETANEVLVAVRVFMRRLAKTLPSSI